MGKKIKPKCECGSGKHPNSCCNAKRPRQYVLKVTPAESVVVNGILRDRQTGMVMLARDGVPIALSSVSQEIIYKGKHGKIRKIVSTPLKLDSSSGLGFTSPHFDVVLAVDTNTRIIHGRNISAGVIVQAITTLDARGMLICEWEPIVLMELHNALASAERIMWKIVCDIFPPDGRKFALVTDSGLGDHDRINRREIPALGGWFLPDHFVLLFATDDSETIPNKLVKACDKLAGEHLDKLALGPTLDEYGMLPAPPGYAFECYREFPWSPNNPP